MRAVKLLGMLVVLSGVGIAASRPGEVLPVALRFVAPLFAQQPTLPDYTPGGHELTFKSGNHPADVATTPPPSVASASQVSLEAKPANEAPFALQSGQVQEAPAARHIDLIAEPLVPRSDAANVPAPASAARAASIDPIVPEDGSSASSPAGDLQTPGKSSAPLIAAKTLFGAARSPAPMASRSIGSYAHGCLSGGVALPVDGPAWQAMRLSRNRTWGHPNLIRLVERLAGDAQKLDGWPGLLVGDISQPRGGPMLTGHASHQVGLDADVWLTPMPDHKLTNKEREEINATSMLDSTDLAVDPKIFTPERVKLIKRAASYPEVERVLVHPAIKKALCEAAGTDRKWLGKVRPIGGHYYHFHIRIACPPGSTTCVPQAPPSGDDGCGKEVQEWLARLAPSKTPPAPKPPGYKPPPPKPPLTMAQLPSECIAVLESGPGGVPVPASDKMDLKMIANMPAALRPHLRKIRSAGK